VSDARWFDVLADAGSAARHYARAAEIHAMGAFEDLARLADYRDAMALMHALQAAHTSMESALLRVFALLDEEAPTGSDWHADLLRRAAAPMPERRPAILDDATARDAHESRRFRHRAMHTYDDFDASRVGPAVEAARRLAVRLVPTIIAFRNAIDPPNDANART
jgi:hypothetical protein